VCALSNRTSWLAHELDLIEALNLMYFTTVPYDVVRFANEQNILCRGAARP
jgi:DNA polymerase III alpha subunit